jgi:RNA polymerase sigma-70 factor, ECF subfamily
VSDTLEWIYRGHRQGLYRLALAITRSAADAEDAVHEAFSRLCRKPMPTGAEPVAYVFAAVRNAAVDRVRRRKEPPAILMLPCLDGADGAVSDKERDQAIAAAVDGLPEELRIVVCLRIFADLSFREIGELVDSPLQTVASRYAAALERLKPGLRKWL